MVKTMACYPQSRSSNSGKALSNVFLNAGGRIGRVGNKPGKKKILFFDESHNKSHNKSRNNSHTKNYTIRTTLRAILRAILRAVLRALL